MHKYISVLNFSQWIHAWKFQIAIAAACRKIKFAKTSFAQLSTILNCTKSLLLSNNHFKYIIKASYACNLLKIRFSIWTIRSAISVNNIELLFNQKWTMKLHSSYLIIFLHFKLMTQSCPKMVDLIQILLRKVMSNIMITFIIYNNWNKFQFHNRTIVDCLNSVQIY